MKNAPTWLSVIVGLIVLFSGGLAMYANFLTVRSYYEAKKAKQP